MEEQPSYRCPIELGIAATENRIEGFSEEAKENDFITHDIIRNTVAERANIDFIHNNGCPGAVVVDGEIRCPYKGALAQAQNLQYINGETVHADGNMQTDDIKYAADVFMAKRNGEPIPERDDAETAAKSEDHHGQYL